MIVSMASGYVSFSAGRLLPAARAIDGRAAGFFIRRTVLRRILLISYLMDDFPLPVAYTLSLTAG